MSNDKHWKAESEEMWLDATSDEGTMNDEDGVACGIDIIGGRPLYWIRGGIVENGSVHCASDKHQIREVSAEVWRDCVRLQHVAEVRRIRQDLQSALFDGYTPRLEQLKRIAGDE